MNKVAPKDAHTRTIQLDILRFLFADLFGREMLFEYIDFHRHAQHLHGGRQCVEAIIMQTNGFKAYFKDLPTGPQSEQDLRDHQIEVALYFKRKQGLPFDDLGYVYFLHARNGVITIQRKQIPKQSGWVVRAIDLSRSEGMRYPTLELFPIWEDADHPRRHGKIYVVKPNLPGATRVHFKDHPLDSPIAVFDVDGPEVQNGYETYIAFSTKAAADDWATKKLVELSN